MINRRRFLTGTAAALTVGLPEPTPPKTTYVECILSDLEIENSEVIRALFDRFQRENRVIRDECRYAWLVLA